MYSNVQNDNYNKFRNQNNLELKMKSLLRMIELAVQFHKSFKNATIYNCSQWTWSELVLTTVSQSVCPPTERGIMC